MHVHILGICGSFMGGIAAIAQSLGHKVTGSDKNVYPPMSTQLEKLGITLTQGWDESQFDPAPDIVVIGNAMSRGNPAVEYVLNRNLPYTSGPQWLLENLLKDRWVIGLSGTHGKTTTASMVAWILEYAGLNPGFLIGGIPQNFDISARVGDSPFFVIEADEYDSAFFDKRSKFVHYRPKTVTINNMEYDHADIFPNIESIQTQFHHLLRMVPSNGLVVTPYQSETVDDTLKKGCWSENQQIGRDWQANLLISDGSHFTVSHNSQPDVEINWSLIGKHNVSNALMAIAAAHHAGVKIDLCAEALCSFKSVKRRMELKGDVNQIRVYDDFAHHPTAIKTTLQGLRNKVGSQRIIAVLEPRSNTMKMGIHADAIAEAWQSASEVHVYEPEGLNWSLADKVKQSTAPAYCYQSVDNIVSSICMTAQPNDHIVIMTNGGFEGIHQKILEGLKRG